MHNEGVANANLHSLLDIDDNTASAATTAWWRLRVTIGTGLATVNKEGISTAHGCARLW